MRQELTIQDKMGNKILAFCHEPHAKAEIAEYCCIIQQKGTVGK